MMFITNTVDILLFHCIIIIISKTQDKIHSFYYYFYAKQLNYFNMSIIVYEHRSTSMKIKFFSFLKTIKNT